MEIDLCLLAVNAENEEAVIAKHPTFESRGAILTPYIRPARAFCPCGLSSRDSEMEGKPAISGENGTTRVDGVQSLKRRGPLPGRAYCPDRRWGDRKSPGEGKAHRPPEGQDMHPSGCHGSRARDADRPQKGGRYTPHKHTNKIESFHVIEGSADVLLFEENGKVAGVIAMGECSSGRHFYYRLSEPRYHTLLVRSDWFIFHEVTSGPFDRADTLFAPWGPEVSDEEGQKKFLKRMAAAVKAASRTRAEGILTPFGGERALKTIRNQSSGDRSK